MLVTKISQELQILSSVTLVDWGPSVWGPVDWGDQFTYLCKKSQVCESVSCLS